MIGGIFSLTLLVYPLLPIAVAFVILRQRNRTAPSERAHGVIYFVQIIGICAAGWAALLAIFHTVLVFQPFTAINVSAAVAPFEPWSIPRSPLADAAPGAYVIFTDVEQVRVAVSHADITTQLLQASGNVLLQLPTIAIGAFVAILCQRIIRNAPFAAELARLSWIGAGVFLVAGFAGQVLDGLASYRLVQIAFDLIGANDPSAELPTPVWPNPLDLWPLWGALALAVLAVLIRHGASLQRETEGLV